ncbi:MAG: hypothetical protein HY609_03070 [Deltaproteobacteria bacterium]|nr:hypothetical protein [Deltaproteobacteria bacterium]
MGVKFYEGDLGAEKCRAQAEQETQKPHRIAFGAKLVGSSPVQDVISYEVVEPFPECRADVVFDSYLGANQNAAKECAASLSRITGGNYEARRVARRRILSDVYQVIQAARK